MPHFSQSTDHVCKTRVESFAFFISTGTATRPAIVKTFEVLTRNVEGCSQFDSAYETDENCEEWTQLEIIVLTRAKEDADFY